VYDAQLENWVVLKGVLWGEIMGDTRGRFPDGTLVRTSKVEGDPYEFKVGDEIKTKNTTYKLGNKA